MRTFLKFLVVVLAFTPLAAVVLGKMDPTVSNAVVSLGLAMLGVIVSFVIYSAEEK